MGRLRVLQKFSFRRRWWIAGGVIITIIASIVALAAAKNELPSRVDTGAVVVSERLLTAAGELQQSLTTASGQSARHITAAYLQHLRAIEKDCQDMNAYAEKSKQQAPSSDTTVYLKKSEKLCNDLASAASDSRKIYEANEPVLAIDTHLKRYQTLPFIRDSLRSAHEAAVDRALTGTTSAVSSLQFHTQSYALLQQLQSAIKASNQLDYFPALAQFQQSLLAERVRYWNSYVDLHSLISVLESQVRRYCQNLPSEDAARFSECHS